MAQPTESILVIATDTLGGDGFTNKEAPTAPVTNEGYGKQSLPYQQLNYMFHWQAEWLKYINEEQIPAETSARSAADVVLQGNIDTINNTTIPALQGDIDTINNTTIPNETTARTNADIGLQNQINDITTAVQVTGNDVTITNDFEVTGAGTVGGFDMLTDIAHSFSTNGYQTLSNGLILQWGTSNQLAHLATQNISFPIVFPTACFGVNGGDTTPSGDNTNLTIFTKTVTTSGFTAFCDSHDVPSGTMSTSWIAIGY